MLEKVGFYDVTLTTEAVTGIIKMLGEGSQAKLQKLRIVEPDVEEEALDLLLQAEAAEENNILKIGAEEDDEEDEDAMEIDEN